MSENTRERDYPLPFLGLIDRQSLSIALAPRLRDQYGIEEFEIAKWNLDFEGRYRNILRPQDIRRGVRIVIVVIRYPDLSPQNHPALP